MKKLSILLILSLAFWACEKSVLKAENEFYNKSLQKEITGYEIWHKEAEEFADQNKWAQKINEPLIGYFDIYYFKKKSSNADIKVILNYVVDVKTALTKLEADAAANNYNFSEGEIQTQFYFIPDLGQPVYQTWTIPADSLISRNKKDIKEITLDYEQFTTPKSSFRDETGNFIVVNPNSVNKSTVLEPSTSITIQTNYGRKGTKKVNIKTMASPKKIIDFI
jgi:hypothetical protein